MELQNELAVRRCHQGGAPGMVRLIWLPAGTQPLQPSQAAFIARLHTDDEAQFGADLITGDLETLRLGVRTALERLARPQPPRPDPIAIAALPQCPLPDSGSLAGRRRRVHLMHCEPDRKTCIELLLLLGEQADVTRPVFVGDAGALREANQALLFECDEVWLYYGSGDEAWKYHQRNDLRRIRALRNERPLPSETVVLAVPNSDDKDVLAAAGEPGCAILDFREGATPQARAEIAKLLGRSTPGQ
jgi:hypothetical protein